MKEEYKILEQNLEVLNKNSEKYKKTMKIHDIGVDTTSFSEFFDNSFNFKEIKSDYLSNLISFSFLKKVGGFYQWPLLCFSNLVENSIIHGKANTKNNSRYFLRDTSITLIILLLLSFLIKFYFVLMLKILRL